jgi:hypothetical protein
VEQLLVSWIIERPRDQLNILNLRKPFRGCWLYEFLEPCVNRHSTDALAHVLPVMVHQTQRVHVKYLVFCQVEYERADWDACLFGCREVDGSSVAVGVRVVYHRAFPRLKGFL